MQGAVHLVAQITFVDRCVQFAHLAQPQHVQCKESVRAGAQVAIAAGGNGLHGQAAGAGQRRELRLLGHGAQHAWVGSEGNGA